MTHPAFSPGRVALITGAASGIGLAATQKCLDFGRTGAMGDGTAAALRRAADALGGEARAFPLDVSQLEHVHRLKDQVYSAFGEVAFLMNNAGIERNGVLLGDPQRWREILGVNLWGVVNGVQTFAPAMIAQKTPALIVNTGSKQGITTPPGNTAYNVSKAGVKVVTEALAHELRNIDGCQVTAHLLIPGFTYTGLTKATEKPAAAWTSAQVFEFFLDRLEAGDFYILCPDNDVTRELDERRMQWAADDVIKNRPALSRWHADYKEAFATFVKGGA